MEVCTHLGTGKPCDSQQKPRSCQTASLFTAKTSKCVYVCVHACVFAYFQAKFCYIKTNSLNLLTVPKPCHYDCPWLSLIIKALSLIPYSVYKITENEFREGKAKAVCNSRLDQLAFGIRSEGKGSGIYILSRLETQTLS